MYVLYLSGRVLAELNTPGACTFFLSLNMNKNNRLCFAVVAVVLLIVVTPTFADLDIVVHLVFCMF